MIEVLFVRQLYPQEFNGFITKSIVWIGCGFVGTVLFLPTEMYTSLIGYFKLVSLFSLIYIICGFFVPENDSRANSSH